MENDPAFRPLAYFSMEVGLKESIPPFMPSPDIEFSIFVSCVIDGDDGFSILSLAEFPQAAKPAAKTTDRAAARAARRILIA